MACPYEDCEGYPFSIAATSVQTVRETRCMSRRGSIGMNIRGVGGRSGSIQPESLQHTSRCE